MPDSLYERDFLAWSEQQAALLRRLSLGKRLDGAIDWPHVIEEVQDLGMSELRSCQSLLRQAMIALLRTHAWPLSSSAQYWLDDGALSLDELRDRFSPSMRQRLDVATAYSDALRRVRAAVDSSGPAVPLPDDCPYALDELLGGDVVTLLGKLGATRR